MAMHFAAADQSLREQFHPAYDGIWRWILAAAPVLGWVMGVGVYVAPLGVGASSVATARRRAATFAPSLPKRLIKASGIPYSIGAIMGARRPWEDRSVSPAYAAVWRGGLAEGARNGISRLRRLLRVVGTSGAPDPREVGRMSMPATSARSWTTGP